MKREKIREMKSEETGEKGEIERFGEKFICCGHKYKYQDRYV